MDSKQSLLKSDISSGKVTSQTIASLADVLKPRPGSSRKNESSANHGRSQQVFATDIFNLCLKQLSGKKPLQSRSGNETPKSSPVEGKEIVKTNFNAESIARCASLAISWLVATDEGRKVARDSSNLNLETGMITLVGKMISHKLFSLAAHEMCSVKRRFEKGDQGASRPNSGQAVQKVSTSMIKALLNLQVDFKIRKDLLPLAITYQIQLLKIMVGLDFPGLTDASLQLVSLDSPNSPCNLVSQSYTPTSSNAEAIEKMAKNLEVLSTLVWSLAPSVSPSNDLKATKDTSSSSPSTAFQVQCLALELRKQWWKLAGHRADIEKELTEPFVRCLAAFVRRTQNVLPSDDRFILASEGARALGVADLKGDNAFGAVKAICLLACETTDMEETQKWLRMLSKHCTHLSTTNARKLAVDCRAIWLSLQNSRQLSSTTKQLTALRDSLSSQLSGSSLDYMWLIQELASLGRSLEKLTIDDPELAPEVTRLSARFAQQFAKSYVDKCHLEVLEIIVRATACSLLPVQSLDWISPETSQIFIRAGVVKDVADRARFSTLFESFTGSPSALAFSKILDTMMLKAIRSCGEDRISCSDIAENLEKDQKACILQWQLRYCLGLSEKPKYHQALQKIVPQILQRLASALPACDFPLRRLVVALMVHQMRDVHPLLVPDRISEVWLNTPSVDKDHLGYDSELVHFVDDLNANIGLARSLYKGHLTPSVFSKYLDFWRRHLDAQQKSSRIYDPNALHSRIWSLATYFNALGETKTCHDALTILLQLCVSDKNVEHTIDCLVNLCSVSLQLLRSGSALEYLEQARELLESNKVVNITLLHYHVVCGQYNLAHKKLDETKTSLAKAQEVRVQIDVRQLQKRQRKLFERLHADGWLLHSDFLLKTGMTPQATAAGRWSMKLYNGMWASEERKLEVAGEPLPEDIDNINEYNTNGLTNGISKLNFKDALGKRREPAHHTKGDKGAAFWFFIPEICRCLRHLSELYTHHGMFHEADYYSKRSLALCESMGPSKRLAELFARRCIFLVQAGNLEEAELHLEKAKNVELSDCPHTELIVLQAEAALKDAEGSCSDAIALYCRCKDTLDKIKMQDLNRTLIQTDSNQKAIEVVQSERSVKQKSTLSTRSTSTRSMKPNHTKARKPPQVQSKSIVPSLELNRSSETLAKQLERDFRDHLAILQIREGTFDSTDTSLSITERDQTISHRHLRYEDFLRQALVVLESDVSLGVVLESCLALPGLKAHTSTRITKTKKARPTSKSKETHCHENNLMSLLDCTWKSLHDKNYDADFSTIICHKESSMQSRVSLLRSAFGFDNSMDLYDFAYELEHGRSHAFECEKVATLIDLNSNNKSDFLAWPKLELEPTIQVHQVRAFQQTYIDIIPKPWTTISISLSEKGDELYIARYRSGEPPFFLRLPFARQRGDEDGTEQPFDYHAAKSELEDIIQLSNYSCHNYGDLNKRGAKTDWWETRESLDTRLQELLANIQNIWFGGFQGALSITRVHEESLSRFRESFESILRRHLPSRAKVKPSSKRLKVAENILELFTSLDINSLDEADTDDHLTDLLYFVVDTLQFGGEPNAYDEIDFDNMIVEVTDAIRDYNNSAGIEESTEQHLILVLDRKLQRFPWESLPCLQHISTSRVGSMQSLRECILAMNGPESHNTDNHSGNYILNPSGDLKSTQETLEPVLSKLTASSTSHWTAMVNQVPSEETISNALTTSSISLYFGHGGGSQYIRPRAVKKLERCSEVVWLMGCSSGAVTEYGDLEPFALPYSYLMAGTCTNSNEMELQSVKQSGGKCLSVLATLWDVTDRDIDRFSVAVGEEWGLWTFASHTKLEPIVPAKSSTRRQRRDETPSTPLQISKTPKTPKVCKTSAAKTPLESLVRTEPCEPGTWSLSAAVNRSRDACYLRYLNGAAPVVYGIPVYLKK